MKRCRFGGLLLVLILVAGLWLNLSIGKFHQGLSVRLTQAAQLTGESREEAQKQVDSARDDWERRRFLTAALHDHAPMEEIEEHFALLTPAAEAEDFRETCLRLAAQLKALGESQLPTWENLF